ncbi:MAG: hypothetical protein IJU46_01175 [Clostridia bacterium]|nr:hypothetical protein [Clostridia bacterium]
MTEKRSETSQSLKIPRRQGKVAEGRFPRGRRAGGASRISVAVLFFAAAASVICAALASCAPQGADGPTSQEPLTEAAGTTAAASVGETTSPQAPQLPVLWETALRERAHSFDTVDTCGSSSHLQGICVDDKLEYMYFSYTDVLAKLDMKTGKVVGSVGGFGKGSFGTSGGAHLGCLAWYDGRVYGSLEYKDPGKKFFICVFDPEKITRVGMDMKEMDEGVDAVLLYEPTADFRDPLSDRILSPDGFAVNEQLQGHRFGCSGIDGVTFGRIPGAGNRIYMLVAYGVYGAGDWTSVRFDNDYNIIQAYDPGKLTPERLFRFTYERGLSAGYEDSELLRADETYYVFTGNTRYGVQNLEYEVDTGNLILCTYGTRKEYFSGASLFVTDGSREPEYRELEAGQHSTPASPSVADMVKKRAGCYADGDGKYPSVPHLPLLGIQGNGLSEKVWGASGVKAAIGGGKVPAKADTGIISLGGGYWYIADGATSVSLWKSDAEYNFTKAG